ncbi:MAG: tetratricopeptide repeat protein [Betaproteobacteria bacterium]|jgi:Flp pilus assembly protein TadD|nr:MAG: tetratricopeptide repeat protein [Betaproteobacteria bacterium]
MSRITRYLMRTFAVLSLFLSGSVAFANLGDTDDSAIDDPGFSQGRAAIEAEDWAEAINVLKKTADIYPDSADTHNFLGYAYRQAGNLDAAFQHYQRALEIDPAHKHAHEYLGEAYLMTKDLASAEQHLAELAKICTPIPCEEYQELKRSIDAFKAR